MSTSAISVREYDRQWRQINDFIRWNPGARHRRRWISRLIEKISCRRVLDVGCGNAELFQDLFRFSRTAPSYTGVDISEFVIENNRKNFNDGRAEFYILDIERGVLDERFDLVICNEVLEHLEDRLSALRNISTMLNEGGHLVITVPTGPVSRTERHWGHTTHPDIEELQSLAERFGFQAKCLCNWGWPFYRATKIITNLNPGWSIKHFGTSRYSPGKKLVCRMLYWINYLNFPNSRFGCQIFALYVKTGEGVPEQQE